MRSRGRASPAGLTWPHRPAIPVIVICAAPTNAGGGKAVPAGAEAGCPGLSRYGPGGNSLLQAEPALGTGERIWSALREARRPCSVARRTKAAFCCRPRPKTRRPPLSKRLLLRVLCELPPTLRQPLALENSSEMVQFKELESATGLRTYLCRPHSPWQGGSNENEGGHCCPTKYQ